MRPKCLVLAILDGWGVASPSSGNAISLAHTPYFNSFIRDYPAMTLEAAGEAVGLPWGEAGNSEVGHMAIGSGMVVYHEFPRINKAISDESFFQNSVLLGAINQVRQNKSRLHLIGLIGSGGVHSHQNHLYALLELARRENIEDVYIHVILDGRDAPYNAGADALAKLEDKISELGVGKIASVVGRFYAMDRDRRWDRVSRAYKVVVNGEAENYSSTALEAVKRYYEEGIFDEEMPAIAIGANGAPAAVLKSGDAVILFNFRADRMRELTRALAAPEFEEFPRDSLPKEIYLVTMTEYEEDLPVRVAFPRERVSNPVAKVASDHNLKQLHIAETEKYAHVTYFFNGGFEKPFPGEDHDLIPSLHVTSYVEAPAMSVEAIAERVVKEVLAENYDFIVVNFANADMVGHTGNMQATIQAIEVLDRMLGQISDAVLAKEGMLLITADHGNAEVILNPQTGEIDKEHNASPVPFIAISSQLHGKTAGIRDTVGGDLSLRQPAGVLADVAPTVLKILDLPIPPEMTGRPLL